MPSSQQMSSRSSRPTAARYFICDTALFPDSMPVKRPTHPLASLPVLHTVAKPTAGHGIKKLSNNADAALLGEPTLFDANLPTISFLPSIGDLLPDKQKAPENLYGKSLISILFK